MKKHHKNRRRSYRSPQQREEADLKVLRWIQNYQWHHGVAPSRDEIFRGMGLSHLSEAHRSVVRLRERGLLTGSSHSHRDLKVEALVPPVVSPGPDADRQPMKVLPLLGSVAAGRPLELVDQKDVLEIPSALLKKSGEHFVLRVQGDSMVEDHICSGDFIVVRHQSVAEQGEIVVALLDGGATLKRFYRYKNQIELRPAHAGMASFFVEAHQRLEIVGVMVGLLRSFDGWTHP